MEGLELFFSKISSRSKFQKMVVEVLWIGSTCVSASGSFLSLYLVLLFPGSQLF